MQSRMFKPHILTVPATDGRFNGKSLKDSQPLIDWNYATTPQKVSVEARENAVKGR